MELSGSQLEVFYEALLDAYPRREELKMFLRIKLDRRLDEITNSGNYKLDVFTLVETADTDGWWRELYQETRAYKHGNISLRRAGRVLGFVDEPSGQFTDELTDVSEFDLTESEEKFWEVRYAAGTEGILGFLVRSTEDALVTKLCKRFERSLPPAQSKVSVTLSPEYNTVNYSVSIIARYRPDLAEQNIICHVRTEGAESAMLEEFWNRLCEELQSLKRFLVVVFSGTSTIMAPGGITELPIPEFQPFHIAKWTSEMSQRLRWSPADADAWTQLIRTQSMNENMKLDPRYLYDALEESLKHIREDRDGFCRLLRGGY
jgi:hypothetical protein